MFDSHCHLDRIPHRPDAALARARTAGVKQFLIAGVEPAQWRNALRWAQPGVFLSFGLHPWWVSEHPMEVEEATANLDLFLAEHRPQTRAIGETGLDFRRATDSTIQDAQRCSFERHIAVARRLELPLVLHVVNAHAEALRMLRSCELPAKRGVVHSFSGSAETAAEYNRLGFRISFSGAITHPKRHKLHRAAASVPDDMMLVETDSPDQPPWERHPAPNEPAFLIDVISRMAILRDQSPEEIARITTENALRLFECDERRELQTAPTI